LYIFGFVAQVQGDHGIVGGSWSKMLKHDHENIQFVGIPHHFGRDIRPLRQIGRQETLVVQNDGGTYGFLGLNIQIAQQIVLFQGAYPELTMVNGLAVVKGSVGGILRKSADVMKERRPQRNCSITCGKHGLDSGTRRPSPV
jgi:hypothetical protein